MTSTQQIFKRFGANKSKVILLLLKLPLRFSCLSSFLIYASMRFLFWEMLKQKNKTGLHAKIVTITIRQKLQLANRNCNNIEIYCN